MSKRYPGGIIRKTPQTPSQTSAQGIWDMASVTQAVKENTWPIAGVPDPISRSLRFRSSASAYLNRTPASAGNRKTWTWSGWVKRGTLGATNRIFTADDGSAFDDQDYNTLFFTSSDQIKFAGNLTDFRTTTAVYRDPSAWYHIVFVTDTTQATAANRFRLYVNGVEVTAFVTSNNPSQNTDLAVNNNIAHYIGSISPSGSSYFDGYQAEINFIDGQALTPSSFGNTNDQTGIWQPIAYTGTYGTNGFYLPFSNTASTTTLGYDFSGNSNNWTTNNISLTSGSTYDSMVDVPTQWIPYNTAGDTGALFRGNYCVLNPLTNGSFTTLNGGNLNTTGNSASNNGNSRSSFAFSTGKWYAEFTVNGKTGTYPQYGIMQASDGQSPNNGSPQSGYGSLSNSVAYLADGTKLIANSNTAYGSSYTTGDVIGIAVDADNGAVYFSKNGTFQNSGVPTSGSSKTGAALTWTGGTVELLITIAEYNASGTSTNFGQRPFSYTPPTGFKTLCTTNLSTPTIGATASTVANKYMDATLYTGAGNTSTSITNAGGFQPDFVWTKARSIGYSNYLYDAVRGTGTGASLVSNGTGAEGADASNANLSSFNSNGWTIGTTSGTNALNASGQTFVAWQWKANGSGSTNTAGSITSTVSANTTAGFSIVTYTGNGSASSQTVGHGLNVGLSMLIVKSRATGSNDNGWGVSHTSIASSNFMYLNDTGAATNYGPGQGQPYIGSGSTFSILAGSSGTNNFNGSGATYVAYCFSAVAGYSAFGSYTGNGSSDGPFVFTGFRPRFILFKNASSAGTVWVIFDTARNTYNFVDAQLRPNESSAENSAGSSYSFDILSNGFKVRSSDSNFNGSGDTFIYAAFAESPFKYALAR